MEAYLTRSIDDLARFGYKLADPEIEILERVDSACDALLFSELEAYVERRFNDQIPKVLREKGLFAIPISEEYGGLGASHLCYTLAMERMGQVGLGLVTFVDVQSSLCELSIQEWGSYDQKQQVLKRAAKGDLILAYALTEPEAGSDPLSMSTTFEEKGDNIVLNGCKYLISNGTIADNVIVYARARDAPKEDRKLSAFIVDTKTDGFSVGLKLSEKLGLFTSDTGLLEFKECTIPKENVLGRIGGGLGVAYSALINGRYAIAAGSVGVIEDCLNSVIERSRSRVQHGKAIGKHQLIQRMIAEIASSLEMAKWPTYLAAIKKMEQDRTNDPSLRNEVDLYSALAKRVASKLAYESADKAVQIFGGFGYSILSNPGRHLIDSRVARIYEGTDEILDLKIASRLLGKGFEAYS